MTESILNIGAAAFGKLFFRGVGVAAFCDAVYAILQRAIFVVTVAVVGVEMVGVVGGIAR